MSSEVRSRILFSPFSCMILPFSFDLVTPCEHLYIPSLHWQRMSTDGAHVRTCALTHRLPVPAFAIRIVEDSDFFKEAFL